MRRALSLIAAISGLYDIVVGALLLLAAERMAAWFGAPPWRDPIRYRGYLWVMGPLLKGAGAGLFVADYWLRGSPPSYLLFAASDGTLALVTLWALLRDRRSECSSSAFSAAATRTAEPPRR